MSRASTKELKSITNFDFYPGHYLTGSLASDAASGGFEGKAAQQARGDLEKRLHALVDGDLSKGESLESRCAIATRVFEVLGFYAVDGVSQHEASLRIRNHDYVLKVDKRFPLKAEGDLWLIKDCLDAVHLAPGEDLADEEADSRSIRRGEVEHFYQKPVLVQHRGQAKRLLWKDVITSVFDSDASSCEWLIINQGDRLVLVERGRWQETHAYLEVSLPKLFALNDPVEYQIFEALFSPKAFPIQSAEFFHETLQQNAHKKAAEVTKALRDTVRESIEIIANEILANHYSKALPSLKRFDLKTKDGADQAAQLIFDQSLRYIYRILFMLFAESQERRKGALPVQSRPYQMGYAMERLRDLEGIPFMEKDRNFIQQTLAHTTRIYFKGYNTDVVMAKDRDGDEYQKTDALGFSFPELGTDLFDPAKTPLFQEAILSDGQMQKVIRHLSLAKVGSGKSAKTQRVHYAGLGLNQLGAVYEGLLSLKPEVLRADVILLDKGGKDAAHRFLPAKDKSKCDSKLFARDADGIMTRKIGEFLLTPVGLDRKFSASFYTPEILTRFLAKEAVETLLENGSSLDRMEKLRICEPAMGSGAFLNAVVDELAPRMAREYRKQHQDAYDSYLESCRRKKQEPEKNKAPAVHEMSQYISQAKYHLMQKCVFGVDLNSTAVELAKVSLWLNCLHDEGNLPFLDFKLKHGNSLVGAWITRQKHEDTNWPHFLIPNPKALDPHLQGTVLSIKTWPFIESESRKTNLKSIQEDWSEFTKKDLIRVRLDALTKKVANLYGTHLEFLTEYRRAMGEAESALEKVSVFERFKSENSAYNQLRSMMDYWCSLWFWPHSEIDSIPSSDDFLRGLEWMADTKLSYGGSERVQQLKASGLKELLTAREVAIESKFFHWDLEYADVLSEGGFDLILGNPPWAPVRWEEKDFFEAINPGIQAQKGDSKAKHESYKKELQSQPSLLSGYKDAACRVTGFAQFLKESGTYPLIDRSQINTYRYFYQRFFSLARPQGIHAMIAQDGIVSDQGCVDMRSEFYASLRKLYRFKNELSLFDVDHHVEYAVWFCEKGRTKTDFELIDNLYHPETIRQCRTEAKQATYRGMKNDEGRWEVRGHPLRIVEMDKAALSSLAKFDQGENGSLAKLPLIHGQIELKVLQRLAEHSAKISQSEWCFWRRFDESGAPKAGLITLKPGVPKTIAHACFKGPNVFVGNPAQKYADPSSKTDFSEVDLVSIPDDYFPSTPFQTTEKGLKSAEYRSSTPWGTIHTEEPRIVARQMVNTTGIRTLSSALIPPGPTHVHSMSTLSFKDRNELVYTSGLFHSLIYDFLMRSISGGTIGQGIYEITPTLTDAQAKSPLVSALKVRALRLSCISSHYKDLWKESWDADYSQLTIASDHMPQMSYASLSSTWRRNTCIRDKHAREQALCEIDAIVAILFGFEKDTLLNLYRSQFGVLQKNLQDLPNQKPESEKYHFPRYQQMTDAYDQCVKYLKQIGHWPKKAA